MLRKKLRAAEMSVRSRNLQTRFGKCKIKRSSEHRRVRMSIVLTKKLPTRKLLEDSQLKCHHHSKNKAQWNSYKQSLMRIFTQKKKKMTKITTTTPVKRPSTVEQKTRTSSKCLLIININRLCLQEIHNKVRKMFSRTSRFLCKQEESCRILPQESSTTQRKTLLPPPPHSASMGHNNSSLRFNSRRAICRICAISSRCRREGSRNLISYRLIISIRRSI